MKTCGKCVHWDENECEQPDAGGCFGAPPCVVSQMMPVQKSPLAMPGEPAMMQLGVRHVQIRPAMSRTDRACALYTPRAENGQCDS